MLLCGLKSVAQEVFFNHWTVRDGLSNNDVRTTFRDSRGYLWIGTASGLNRYDGYTFRQDFYYNGMVLDDVQTLQEDGQGNLWVNSSNVFVTSTHQLMDYKDYLPDLHLEQLVDVVVHIDEQKNLLIFHADGILHYDWTNRLLHKADIHHGRVAAVVSNGIETYYLTNEGRLYASMTGWDFSEQPLPDDISQETAHHANNLYLDKNGCLWLHSNQNGFLYYQDSQGWHSLRHIIAGTGQQNIVTSVTGVGDDVWVSTDHQGIFVFGIDKQLRQHIVSRKDIRQSLLSNEVQSLYCDDTGTVWVGYVRWGLSACGPRSNRFSNHYAADFKDVNALLTDTDGTLWIGTDGYGIFQCPAAGGTRRLDIPGGICVSLLEDSKRRIWIGTYLNGLLCYENGRISRHYRQQNSGLSGDQISAIIEDRHGRLWLMSPYGTFQSLDPETERFTPVYYVNEKQEKVELCGMDLAYDGRDIIYAATFFGIYEYNISTGKGTIWPTNHSRNQSFCGRTIQHLCLDSRNRLWIGTSQGISVWNLKTDSVSYLSRKEGLCDNVIRGIFELKDGSVWVTTSSGLSVVREGQICNYTEVDGMMGSQFRSGAFTVTPEGHILLGLADGYCETAPNRLFQGEGVRPHVVFTGLLVENEPVYAGHSRDGRIILPKPIEQTDVIELSYRDSYVTLEYSVMDQMAASKVRYAYRIEGLTEGWIYTNEPRMTLANLSPGTYRLSIKACGSDGTWSDDSTVLTLRVAPPWWLSPWAWCLYVLLALAVLSGSFMWYRNKTLRKIEAEKRKMAEQQEQRINEMKLRFFTNISHDLRTPLTLILSPLQRLLTETKDLKTRQRLGIINKNAEQLLALVNQLLDFRKLELGVEEFQPSKGDISYMVHEVGSFFKDYAESHRIAFEVTATPAENNCELDFVKMRKVVMNLLSNAFKYTPDGGRITCSVCRCTTAMMSDELLLTVSDTGPGISDADKAQVFTRFYQTRQAAEKTGSGIGLHIVDEYVRMHGGKVTITDNMPTGAVFTCHIPMVHDMHTEYKPQAVSAESLEDTGKPVILLVEDNSDLLSFLKEELSDDYQPLTASNGQEALSILKHTEASVQLVVSDVMMPVMDGMQLCRAVKSDIAWSHIPVILLTAKTTDDDKLEGFGLGADDYITKPINLDLLRLRIKKFMEWSERCHRLFSQKIDVEPNEITITSLDEQLINRAIQLVEQHIKEVDYSVATLSEELGLSRGHLYKKLTFITGKSPLEFIHTIRVKRGRQLLDQSGMQIAEVAYAVGYNSPKQFTKYFKQEFGQSPSEYLRQQKG